MKTKRKKKRKLKKTKKMIGKEQVNIFFFFLSFTNVIEYTFFGEL